MLRICIVPTSQNCTKENQTYFLYNNTELITSEVCCLLPVIIFSSHYHLKRRFPLPLYTNSYSYVTTYSNLNDIGKIVCKFFRRGIQKVLAGEILTGVTCWKSEGCCCLKALLRLKIHIPRMFTECLCTGWLGCPHHAASGFLQIM